MAIEIPSGLANLLHGLTGMKWPEANEDQLRAVGDLYRSAASDFDQLADLMTELTSDIKQNFEGETADQFVTEMKDFISGDDYLGTAKKTTSDLAQFADDTANEIEYMKWMTLGTLVQLAAELAFFAATSWINWGAAAEAAAAQAWTRVVLKVLRNKVVSFLLQHFSLSVSCPR